MTELLSGERYARHQPFLTSEEQQNLHNANILIAGCGAGGPVAEHLARLGVGTRGSITLADFDKVSVSNLNRPPYIPCDIDTYKVDALTRHIHSINPEINVNKVYEGITSDNAEELVRKADVVVEMIDISAPNDIVGVHDLSKQYSKSVVTGLDLGLGIMGAVYHYARYPKATLRSQLGIPEQMILAQDTLTASLAITAQTMISPVNDQLLTPSAVKSYYDNWFSNPKNVVALSEVLPQEMHQVLKNLLNGTLDFVPQTSFAAGLLGLTQAAMIERVINNKSVKTMPQKVFIPLQQLIEGALT